MLRSFVLPRRPAQGGLLAQMPERHTPLSEASETDLVRRAQARDQAAFEELMRRTNSISMRLALSIVKNRQEAEDQVQTSFFNAWRRLESFNLESRFSTWMRSIVANQSLMHLRSKRRAPAVSLDNLREDERTWEPADQRPDHESSLAREELTARLRAEIRRLPPLFREVLELRDLQELPIEDVAVRLGVTAAAAKSRLTRARQMLRERMERHVGRSCLMTVSVSSEKKEKVTRETASAVLEQQFRSSNS